MKDLELRKKGGEVKFCVQWSVCGGNGPEAIRRLVLMPGDGLLISMGMTVRRLSQFVKYQCILGGGGDGDLLS